MGQAEQEFEWLIIDGGSTDGTLEHLTGSQSKRMSWISGPDKGIYDAMNKGAELARGEYILFMNAGDTFSNQQSLAQAYSALLINGRPELCYGGANYCFPDGTLRYRAPRILEKAIKHGLPGMHQATYYRRAFLDFPPYDISYRVSADYYITARCYMKGARACYVKSPLADFRLGGRSMVYRNQSLRDCWRIQREVLGLNIGWRLLSAARRYIAHRIMLPLHNYKLFFGNHGLFGTKQMETQDSVLKSI